MRRLLRGLAMVAVPLGALWLMIPFLLNSLLYFPSRHIAFEPGALGLDADDLEIRTDDGETLHGWWFRTKAERVGHVLLFHGNAGNVGDRLLHAQLLTEAGLDVLSFDYRGYGRSSGRPDEEGTYRDGRAARAVLGAQEGVDEDRIVYVGESLGGAVAVALAREDPPGALVLASTFTSVRDMGRLHYPIIPAALVPDAYPSLERIRGLDSPLLLIHGDQDEIVPVEHGRTLFEAAPDPKRLHIFPGLGHNDLITRAGGEWARAIAGWAREVLPSS